MRLPTVPSVSTKDGVSNKNARLTNCLKESKKSADVAVVRPGLLLSDTYAGLGHGLIPFDGRLLLAYDDTIYSDDYSLPWPLDSSVWSNAVTYDYGDAVWFSGELWFSMGNGNLGNSPGIPYWRRSAKSIINIYDPVEVYEVGDEVDVFGTTYYSYAPNNVGNNPLTSPYWGTAPLTSTRYGGAIPSYGSVAAVYGSAGAASFATYNTLWPYKSCATKHPISFSFQPYVGVSTGYNRAPWYYQYAIEVEQWQDAPPYNCSNQSHNGGNFPLGYVNHT